MTFLSWRLAAVALATLAAAPAFAQKPAADPLTGFWKFETKTINQNCKLLGDMEIFKDKAGAYACKFTSVQACTGEPPIEIKVAQSCSAKTANRKVVIQSTITRIVSVKPKDLTDIVKERYAPDHFNVTLNATGSEMTGIFHSVGEATVRFWRPEALTS